MSEKPPMPQGGEFGKDLFNLQDAIDYVGVSEEQIRILLTEDATAVTGVAATGDTPAFTRADLDRLHSLARDKGWTD